jgi:hypothetical protein
MDSVALSTDIFFKNIGKEIRSNTDLEIDSANLCTGMMDAGNRKPLLQTGCSNQNDKLSATIRLPTKGD